MTNARAGIYTIKDGIEIIKSQKLSRIIRVNTLTSCPGCFSCITSPVHGVNFPNSHDFTINRARLSQHLCSAMVYPRNFKYPRRYIDQVIKLREDRRLGEIDRCVRFGTRSHRSIANEGSERIRNIAVVAHVDAGKTTFTERALYYSGYSDFMGNVDSGSSITDFYSIERERGISVSASAISFNWNKHEINLIDTPGHCDFSIGVDQSIRVIDGLIVILDSNAGIEPQTEVVWEKANVHGIPRIIFANKCDRQGYSFEKIIDSIVNGFKNFGMPIPVQYPIPVGLEIGVDDIKSYSRRIVLVDLIRMVVIDWEGDTELGTLVRKFNYNPSLLPGKLSESLIEKRVELIETLSSSSSEVVDEFLKFDGEHLKIPPEVIMKALRKQVIAGKLCPVYFGSALKNMGVQPVLDGVLDYLPSPLEAITPVVNPKANASFIKTPKHISTNTLCAFVFRVSYDRKINSTLFFVRIYTGCLQINTSVWNSSRREKVTIKRLVRVYADKYEDVQSLNLGSIGAIVNLDKTIPGDTLISYADRKMAIELDRTPVEQGLFMLSCEPDGRTTIDDIIRALNLITLEDPSISVVRKGEAKSLTIIGSGILHLQVVEDRLKNVHGLKCKMGKPSIAYLAIPKAFIEKAEPLTISQSYTINKEIFGTFFSAEIEMRVTAHQNTVSCKEVNGQKIYEINSNSSANHIYFDLQEQNNGSISTNIKSGERHSIIEGVKLALSFDSVTKYPVVLMSICITRIKPYGPPSTRESSLRMAASACIKKVLGRLGEMQILEPMCKTRIVVPYDKFRTVSLDVSSQPIANILSEDAIEVGIHNEESMSIQAILPLRVTCAYTERLRSLSGGRGVMTTEYVGYASSDLDNSHNCVLSNTELPQNFNSLL